MLASHRITVTEEATGATREYRVASSCAQRVELDLEHGEKLARLAQRLEDFQPGILEQPAGLKHERVGLLRAGATGRVYWSRGPRGEHVEVRDHSGASAWSYLVPELPAGASRMHDDGELVVEGEPLVVAWRHSRIRK